MILLIRLSEILICLSAFLLRPENACAEFPAHLCAGKDNKEAE